MADESTQAPAGNSRVEGLAYAARLSPLYIATMFVRVSFGISAVVFFDFLQVGLPTGVSFVVFGIVVAASPAAELLFVSPVGVFIDNHGRNKMLLLGLLLAATSMALAPLSQNPVWAAGIHAMHGAAAAMILVTSLALMGDFAHKESRGREMGVFDAVNVFGWITGFAAGFALTALLKPIGYLSFAFIIAGLLLVAAYIYGLVALVEPAERKRSHIPMTATIKLLAQKRILLLVLPWFALYIVIGAALAFLPEGRNTLAGSLDPLLFAGGVFGVGLGLTLTQSYFGKLSDTHGRGKLMLIGAIGLGGLMVVLGAVVALSVPAGTPDKETFGFLLAFLGGGIDPAGVAHSTNYLILALLGVFAICALAFAPAALASLVDHADESMRGTTMAIYSFVITLGMIIGPIAVGSVYQLYYAIGCMSFVILMGVLMFLFTVVKFLDERKTGTESAASALAAERSPESSGTSPAPPAETNGGKDDVIEAVVPPKPPE